MLHDQIISFPNIHLIFGTLICHTKIQIKLEFGFDPLIFPKWTEKNITNYQFSGLLFSLLTDYHLIFGTLLCYTKIHIKLEFGLFLKVMAIGR